MKVVSPDARATMTGGTRTRSMTQAIQALAPKTADLVDAACLFLLCAIALVGFANTFDTWQFLFVGLVGVLLGISSAHLARVLRWHWLTIAVLVMVEFFLLGSAVGLRDDAPLGFVPTLSTLTSLSSLTVSGWKSLLTTLPPVDGGGQYVVLPYLLGLVAGSVGFAVARTVKRPGWVTAAPTVLFVVVVLLGTLTPVASLEQGVGFAGVAFAWLAYRFRQRRRLTGTGTSNRVQVATGAAMLVAAIVGGGVLGGYLPVSATQRVVLRTYVQPPVDMSQYASPLENFRLYSSTTLNKLYDQPLLKVEGANTGDLVRFAVLDDYSSRAWSASGGNGGPETGYQTIGSNVPDVSADGKTTLTITVLNAYAASTVGGLNMWVPNLGETSSVVYAGSNAKAHAGAFRFNLSTMQGIVLDQLKTNDVIKVTSAPISTDAGTDAQPGGSPSLSADSYAFLAAIEKKWSGTATTPWQRLTSVENVLKAGYWSDGTVTGETQYLPGHGQRRLSDFVNGQNLVGSDEQYAATFALLANQIGFPARVVMGAAIPDGGEIKGKNVTAWVELQTTTGWVAIPPSAFIPSRDRHPVQTPQEVSQDSRATDVPPPNPVRAPGSFDQLADGELAGVKMAGGWLSSLLRTILSILLVAGPPVGLLLLVVGGILATKWRRSRRRMTKGSPADRVTAGWREVLDRVRDIGIIVPAGHTRLEESRLIASDAVSALAVRTNTATFGQHDPDDAMAREVWASVRATKKALLRPLGRWRRMGARLNLRSLLPERFAAIQLPRVTFKRPRRAGSGSRLTSGTQPGLSQD